MPTWRLPKTVPRATNATASTATPRSRSTPRWERTRTGIGSGAPLRTTANTSVPATTMTNATSSAQTGEKPVEDGHQQYRCEGEGQLVGDGLEGEGRAQPARAAEHVRPAGADHRADLRHRGARPAPRRPPAGPPRRVPRRAPAGRPARRRARRPAGSAPSPGRTCRRAVRSAGRPARATPRQRRRRCRPRRTSRWTSARAEERRAGASRTAGARRTRGRGSADAPGEPSTAKYDFNGSPSIIQTETPPGSEARRG